MKRIIMILITLLPLMTNAFSLQAYCQVNRAQATCFVNNHLYQPVFCQAQATGITSYGYAANAWANGWIYPGQSVSLYVYAQNPYNDPLMNAQVFTNCRF